MPMVCLSAVSPFTGKMAVSTTDEISDLQSWSVGNETIKKKYNAVYSGGDEQYEEK